MADLAVKPAMVLPMNVFCDHNLEIVDPFPWAKVADHFGFIERVQRLGHRVVIAVTFGPDRADGLCLGETIVAAHGAILTEFNRLISALAISRNPKTLGHRPVNVTKRKLPR